MRFNSWEFPLFFLIIWGIYLILKRKQQNLWLLAASYVFYGWWDWRFTSLLAISTIMDYVCGNIMDNPRMLKWGGGAKWRKGVLVFSLCTNLGILGFFKYFNFFADSFERAVAPLGFTPDFITLNIILPVGISFYTFQTMAYVIDVYRGKEKPCRNFWDFALYVAYFPQLVAGPIERAGNLIPQFQKERNINPDQFYAGVRLIFWGFFKKIFIADSAAPFVNQCFANPEGINGIHLLFGAYLFALQVYGDFSGYTDIARGISRLFGIELCLNFRQPYLSTSITDFWRRWHISLSNWLRDYLYIPLGGNRKGTRRTYINLMLTMLLGGLWHGAALTFIIWGGLHGLYLAVHKAVTGKKVNSQERDRQRSGISRFLSIFVTFNLICFAWVFFRADTLGGALTYISGIFTQSEGIKLDGLQATFILNMLVVFALDSFCEKQKSEVPLVRLDEAKTFWQKVYNNAVVRGFLYSITLFFLVFIGGDASEPFVYFQF
ncbi:O-acyltransferase [Planctomycetales bacterium]|nr:O-acyltransferase [Planctomycetales bacterium]